MDRREFLKKTAAIGFGAGLYFLPRGLRNAANLAAQENYPDLVSLRGGSPEAMFDRGIQMIGGMSRFVKKGQTVVIKPNMSFNAAPEFGSNTNPGLVAAVVKHCRDAGARRVIIMDHSLAHWESARNTSGIYAAATSAGAVYVPAEKESYYQKVSLNGKRLKETMIHETLLESDVLISVPVLKHHGGAGMSCAIKNLMGCVWNRNAYHRDGLQTCIADFLYAKKPALSIVDAYRVVTRNGPGGGSLEDVAQLGYLIISPDIVAADAAASALVSQQGKVEYIRLAAQAGFGQNDLTKLNIGRVTL